MVKIGIICEGPTEEILFLSENFKKLLAVNNLSLVNVINAQGSGNLLPHNRDIHVQSLQLDGAEKVLIITDLDTDACITLTKKRIDAENEIIVIIAVKEIESWFLASTETMRKILKQEAFEFPFPEKELEPFETVNRLLFTNLGRGIGKKSSGKINLVNSLLNAGLDISQAASHPNCPSAAYFINKLTSLT